MIKKIITYTIFLSMVLPIFPAAKKERSCLCQPFIWLINLCSKNKTQEIKVDQTTGDMLMESLLSPTNHGHKTRLRDTSSTNTFELITVPSTDSSSPKKSLRFRKSSQLESPKNSQNLFLSPRNSDSISSPVLLHPVNTTQDNSSPSHCSTSLKNDSSCFLSEVPSDDSWKPVPYNQSPTFKTEDL